MKLVRKPNKLIHATSPYLLQHAYNPVAWEQWGPSALARAKKEDKPILVSIGYSSCHWCHVMERESFELESVAQIMNDYFVCIKVDREERPDVDQVYMEAVQAMGGHGGWPLNVFLTPDQKPFYGGTYFPAANWVHLMKQIHTAFVEKRNDLEVNAAQLTSHLSVSDLQRFTKAPDETHFTMEGLEKMFLVLTERFDKQWGGIEKAPKFVMPSVWLFLLRYHAITKSPEALRMVHHTLIKMQQGGLYDQLGGGFSRYSVDGRWFAPHFEKMLYDNAQLVSLYSEAFKLATDVTFKRVVYDTVEWLKREMRHADGGFYSALDADSENIEGKFYTWTYSELEEVLGKKTPAIASFYGATNEGNWEHGRNILMDTSAAAPSPELLSSNEKLLAKRNMRIHPGLDDKILTGWNALMIKGLLDAYTAFGDTQFLELAQQCIGFLEQNVIADGKVYRSFKGKRAHTEGFLEDYAFLIQAYSTLYQCTFQEEYLDKARHWCAYVVTNFFDASEGYFHFSANGSEELIARKKEIFDNVIPGSNSVMAMNLFRLGTSLQNTEWKTISENMVRSLGEMILGEPVYLSNWGILMEEVTVGISEIVIVGKEAETKRRELSAFYIPFSIVMGTLSSSTLPLFEGRNAVDGTTKIYVCYDKTCQLPVEHSADAMSVLEGHNQAFVKPPAKRNDI